MKLQLILENQEVELNEKISIPLNKTYENLYNPMDIVVDYSKSINIPMTSKNNNILANSYRLDRTILAGGDAVNLGIYLDPTKKIPMKLLYNGSVVLDGYAKFVSANNSTKNRYYTLNLFGVIGDIFQKLKSVVLSSDKLTDEQKNEEDGGAKYILHDRCNSDPRYLDSSYVHESWNNTYNSVYGYYYNPETGQTSSANTPDVIGFAPSYRGYYNEFESGKIQLYDEDDTSVSNDEKIVSISDYLTSLWKEKYKTLHPSATDEYAQEYAEALGADDVVGDGIKDYQMVEYRSYYMKPFIYFNQLLQMFQDHIKWHTDYQLELDTNWFNMNNPYWTRMCYMLDFIDSKDSNQDSIEPLTSAERIPTYNIYTSDNFGSITNQLSSSIATDYILKSSEIVTEPFNVELSIGGKTPIGTVLGGGNAELNTTEGTYFILSLLLIPKTGLGMLQRRFFASFDTYEVAKQYIIEDDFNEQTYIQLTKPNEPEIKYYNWEEYLETGDWTVIDMVFYYKLKIPIPSVSFQYGTANSSISLIRTVTIKNNNNKNLVVTKYRSILGGTVTTYSTPTDMVEFGDSCAGVVCDNINVYRSWRDLIQVNLQNIYFKEDAPLFDIILQYTKMFGLMWVPDYENGKIHLLHKSTYFKDYKIEDWSDKLDRSKDFIIEPITFGSRFIAFNYEDVDGFRYTGYKDKYGVNYGNKTISTGYEFGYETKDLFENISPSSASSKSYIDIYTWGNWDLSSRLTPTPSPIAYIDCEDEEESSAISIYNWYLRGLNVNTDNQIYITDDSPLMISRNEYCWLHPSIVSNYGHSIGSMPTFNIAINEPELFPDLSGRVLSTVFNTPNEDFTTSKLPSESNGNSIYDLFWHNYINERYNVQNKKVTAYFNLSSTDYMNFSFNKFIVIDNQLFMVNKIFDFDLNSNGLTKVELVQITKTSAYTNGSESFPPIVLSPSRVIINGSTTDEGNGSESLTATVTLFDENGDLTKGNWENLEGRMTIFNGEPVDEGDTSIVVSDYVFTEYGDWEINLCRDTNVLYWYDMSGNRFEGSVTYTYEDQSWTIPIIIDYTQS